MPEHGVTRRAAEPFRKTRTCSSLRSWVKSFPRSRCASSSGRRAPSAGTRSPASTPTPTSSWSASGRRPRPRRARTPASWPSSAASSGIKATTDRDALIALAPDAIVHTAMADDRVFECIEDLTAFVEAGINVTSSGPVLLQWPEEILPPEMIEQDRRRVPQGQRQHAHQRHRPGVRQRRAAAGHDQPEPAHRRGPGHGDLRLLDLLPAGRDERPLRLRQADGRGRHDLRAGDPGHGLGQRGPPDRGRSRHHPRRAADRGGRPARGRVGHRRR